MDRELSVQEAARRIQMEPDTLLGRVTPAARMSGR